MAKEPIQEEDVPLNEQDKERKLILSYHDFISLRRLEEENKKLKKDLSTLRQELQEGILEFKNEEGAIKVEIPRGYKGKSNITFVSKFQALKEFKEEHESLIKEVRERHYEKEKGYRAEIKTLLDEEKISKKRLTESQNSLRIAEEKIANLKKPWWERWFK